MEAFLYKKKNANGFTWSYIICIDGHKPDPAWINDGSAATNAINHKTTLDGRSLWLDLVKAYEGEDAKKLAISAAQKTIPTTYFTHESMNFTFTDYSNKHMAANNELLLRGVPMNVVSQVYALL